MFHMEERSAWYDERAGKRKKSLMVIDPKQALPLPVTKTVDMGQQRGRLHD
jgi:hypothetical protein